MNKALLDDADRIAVTDLYPARCRTAVASLAAALREQSLELAESRQYALALGEELRVRAEKTDNLLLLANSMDADFEAYTKAHPADLADALAAALRGLVDEWGRTDPGTLIAAMGKAKALLAAWEGRK